MKKVFSLIICLTVFLSFAACNDEKVTESRIPDVFGVSYEDAVGILEEEESFADTELSTQDEATASPEPEEEENDTEDNSIDPDFKAAMDSYEEFFYEYVEIMKKLEEDPSDISVLADYAKYMGQYAEMMQKFEAWESEDLNAAETAYYIDVQARITKKLLEAA